MNISFNNYRYYFINDFEKMLKKKKSSENISTITTLILVIINMHIELNKFLDTDIPKIIFNQDKKIEKKLVIIKKNLQKKIYIVILV